MTRPLIAVVAWLILATPFSASATPVTWSWEGVVRSSVATIGPEGLPSTVDPAYVASLLGAAGSGSITLDPDVPGYIDPFAPDYMRYAYSVQGCGFSIGDIIGVSQQLDASVVQISLDGSTMFVGSYTSRPGAAGGLSVFFIKLTSASGPLPGLPFPRDPPPLDALASFGAQTTLAGISDIVTLDLEITRLESVPEPETLAWLGIGAALLFRRSVRT